LSAPRTTPVELAKRFLELSQQKLKMLVVRELLEDDGNTGDRSMQDLYETAQKVKSAMKEKERLFGEILSQQRAQYVEVARQFRAWQTHYNHSLAALQKQTESQEAELARRSSLHESQIQNLRSILDQQQESAKNKILSLTSQLQEVKMISHRRQMEATQHLQAQQFQLKDRIHDLESKLKARMVDVQVAAAKSSELAAQRQELERELISIRADFQALVRNLESQLKMERSARASEQTAAAQNLEMARAAARVELDRLREDLGRQHISDLEAARNASELGHASEMARFKANTDAEQALLSHGLESTRAQMQQLQTTHREQLEREKASAMRAQAALQVQIRDLVLQMKKLKCEKAVGEEKRVKKLAAQGADLKQQVVLLREKYDTIVSSMESKYKLLEGSLDNERQRAQAALNKEREENGRKLDAAYKQVEHIKETLGQTLKAKQDQFHSAIQEVPELSKQTESNLNANLKSLKISLQKQKEEERAKLAKAKDISQVAQRELRAVIAGKEEEVQSLKRWAKEESDRAAAQIQKCTALEQDLGALRDRFEGAKQEWEKRNKAIDVLMASEQRAAAEKMAVRESQSRLELQRAQKSLEDLKVSLQEAMEAKDRAHEVRIRELMSSAQRKEKALADNLARLQQDWNHFKAESHRQLAEEKEKTKVMKKELLAKIAAKERELEEASSIADLESQRAIELLEKRRELERELEMVSEDYDAAIETWEQASKSFEAARKKEQETAIAFIARKEADVVSQVIETLEEASTQKHSLERTLLDREKEHAEQLQEIRDAAKRRETELKSNVSELRQQLEDLRMRMQSSVHTEKEAGPSKQVEFLALLACKDRELAEQRSEANLRAQEALELARQQDDLRDEMTRLRLLHAQSIAELQSRHARLVESHEQEMREAASKIRAAVSTVLKYEEVLASSLEHMGDMEGHLQFEVERLQRLVSSLQRQYSRPRRTDGDLQR
jgi:hypothetical protein